MKLKVFTLNAFSKSINGGNPAGVVLNSDNFSKEQMQIIAKKVGFSETAFVSKSKVADFKLSFFTPDSEIDLCGHATIAVFYLLREKEIIQEGKYTQETEAGILSVEIRNDKTVFMDQNLPEYFELVDKNIISKSLNINPEFIINELPVQIVSTGVKDIIIPIKNLEKLLEIDPDLDAIKKVCKKLDVVGYHLFTFETKFCSAAHCRNFAPLYGINEESATGTSNGALACYLFKYGKINSNNTDNIVFEQGYSLNRPSEIKIKMEVDNNAISKISVGGKAMNIQEIEIEV